MVSMAVPLGFDQNMKSDFFPKTDAYSRYPAISEIESAAIVSGILRSPRRPSFKVTALARHVPPAMYRSSSRAIYGIWVGVGGVFDHRSGGRGAAQNVRN